MKIIKILLTLFIIFNISSSLSKSLDQDISVSQDIQNLEQDIEKRQKLFKEIKSEILDKDLKEISKKKYKLNSYYNNVSKYWREIINLNLDFIEKTSYYNSKDKRIRNFLQTQDRDLGDEFDLKYQSFKDLKNQYILINEEEQYKIFHQISIIRSKILDLDIKIQKNQKYFEDLSSEFKLIRHIPILYFYFKKNDYKNFLKSGLYSSVEITKKVIFSIISIILFFLLKNLLSRSSYYLSKMQNNMIGEDSNRIKFLFVNKTVSFLSLYIKWICLIAFVLLLEYFFKDGIFSEISFIFPYFIYFFLYKIVKSFVSSSLTKILYNSNIQQFRVEIKEYSSQLRKTSRIIGLYILISISLLTLTKSLIYGGLIYSIIYNIFKLLFIAILFLESRRWQEFTKILSKSLFENKLINNSLDSKLFPILCLPILILSIFKIICLKIFKFVIRHDTIKSIWINLYSKKLESSIKEGENSHLSNKLPSKYLEQFRQKDFSSKRFIDIKSHPYREIRDHINLWKNNQVKSNSIVIYGENGVGKTSAMNWVAKNVEKSDLNIIKISIQEKIIDINNFKKKIFDSINQDNLEFNIDNFDQEIKDISQKTLIIIDNCHNLFLSKKDGFNSIKYLLDLLSQNSQNLFFLASFNKYSYGYLVNSLKIDKFFSLSYKIPRWSDINIKDLIMGIHNDTEYKIMYDYSLFSIESINSRKDFEDIENKFFQIIWAKSKGNPKTAIELWISSLKNISTDIFKVGLPLSKYSEILEISDDDLFKYCAISKHYDLSIRQISEILDEPENLVANFINQALEKGYIENSNDDYYKLSSEFQISINKTLINKNFLYDI